MQRTLGVEGDLVAIVDGGLVEGNKEGVGVEPIGHGEERGLDTLPGQDVHHRLAQRSAERENEENKKRDQLK
jgi:hypothetical protein